MRSRMLIIGILFFSMMGHLQGQNKESTIYLKDGSVLVGKELKQDENGNIYFLFNGENMIIKVDDVSYLKYNEDEHIFENKNFVNRTSISYLNGSIGNGYGVQHTLYYKISTNIYTGLGLGINNYLGESGYNLYPLFIDITWHLRNSKTLPYLSMVAGYSFAHADLDLGQIEAEGGNLFAPRLGYVFQTPDVMIDVYCGLRFQKASYTYLIWEGRGVDVLKYKRLEIGLGLSF